MSKRVPDVQTVCWLAGVLSVKCSPSCVYETMPALGLTGKRTTRTRHVLATFVRAEPAERACPFGCSC